MNPRLKHLLLGAVILAIGARPGHAGVTMSDLWPSDDGRSWKYEIHQLIFEDPPVEGVGQIRLLFEGSTWRVPICERAFSS